MAMIAALTAGGAACGRAPLLPHDARRRPSARRSALAVFRYRDSS